MGAFSDEVLYLARRAAAEQGGVISGDNPSQCVLTPLLHVLVALNIVPTMQLQCKQSNPALGDSSQQVSLPFVSVSRSDNLRLGSHHHRLHAIALSWPVPHSSATGYC
jgi:hypothetical protein